MIFDFYLYSDPAPWHGKDVGAFDNEMSLDTMATGCTNLKQKILAGKLGSSLFIPIELVGDNSSIE